MPTSAADIIASGYVEERGHKRDAKRILHCSEAAAVSWLAQQSAASYTLKKPRLAQHLRCAGDVHGCDGEAEVWFWPDIAECHSVSEVVSGHWTLREPMLLTHLQMAYVPGGLRLRRPGIRNQDPGNISCILSSFSHCPRSRARTAEGTFGYMAPESFGRIFTPKRSPYLLLALSRLLCDHRG